MANLDWTSELLMDAEDEYQDTRNLLKTWGLEHLIPTFISNRCTSLELRYMKESHIEKLIPSIGDQIKFKAS